MTRDSWDFSMTPRALWGAATLWLVPFGAWAVELGDIELNSGLDQPLEADIVLVSATPEELSELRANLAAPQTFERYGLDRPGFLTDLQFRITQDDTGRNVIRITSQEAITEPFFAMLVEATWSRGRLLREFTVLLDPPSLLPTVAEVVEPVQTAEPVPVPTPAPAPEPAPVDTPAPAAPDASGTYGPVQRGETLWSITQRYLPSGVTMHQMLAAMFQGNPAAFNGNMNLLLAGASLRIPDRSDATRLSAEEATREALRQTAEWEGSALRQARLRLLPATDEDAADVAGEGSAATAIAELQSENSALRSELAATQRVLELQSEELQALQARLAAVEQGLQAAQTAAALAAERPPAADGPGAQGAATAGVEPQSVAAAPPLPADVVAAPISQPSLLAQMRDWIASAPVLNALLRDDAAGEDAAAGAPGAQGEPAPIGQPALLARLRDWITHPLLLIGLGPAALVGIAVWYLRHRRRAEDDAPGRWEALSAGSTAATDAALDPGPGGIGEQHPQPVSGAAGGHGQPSEALDEAPDRGAQTAAGPQTAASPSAADEVGLHRAPAQGEVDTRLDLARAYIDLGDAEGARSLLEEVVDEGDAAQQQEARTLLAGL